MRYPNTLMRITSILSKNKGATIVELMVVLAILGLGITALLETIG
jgi:prepilin-type N-terminal cleavage/methylation domain-containing protein